MLIDELAFTLVLKNKALSRAAGSVPLLDGSNLVVGRGMR